MSRHPDVFLYGRASRNGGAGSAMSSARGEVVFCDRSTFQKTRPGLMRIESLHFKNITEGWELSETKFDDLNLLVGVSGAGKTQILEAIQQVRRVAFGDPVNSKMQWLVHFSIQGNRFIWEGTTQESLGRPHHAGF